MPRADGEFLRGMRFRGGDVAQAVNRIHPYPGMMAPSIVDAALDEYGAGVTSVLDPFCGTGRALVAARFRGLSTFGIDINPLAIMIARLRLNPPAASRIAETGDDVIRAASAASTRGVAARFFSIPFDWRFWFPRPTITHLLQLLTAIETHTSPRSGTRRAMLVAFSETVRRCSYTRASEHKLYRIPAAERSRWRPNPLRVFTNLVESTADRLARFEATDRAPWRTGRSVLRCGDVRQVCTSKELHGFGCDAVITSPPYGDARTTVAYGEFSRLPLLWLRAMERPPVDIDHAKILSLDRRSLGGRASQRDTVQGDAACNTVDRIMARNPKRARDVAAYLYDLRRALHDVVSILRDRALIVIVLGRRVVAGLRVPLDEIVTEWFGTWSIDTLTTIAREIPYKRLPRRVSRTGEEGSQLALTILEERVVVARVRRRGVERTSVA